MKKFLALLLVAVMALTLFACTETKDNNEAKDTEKSENAADKTEKADGDLAYITDKGKLVVGITDYAPMNYLDENDDWTGFDTEFARKVGEKLGVEVEFVEIEWENKWLSLESKQIDCVWNGMTITEEALTNADVTNAYVVNAQVVVMKDKKAADIKSADDLEGLKIAVESGSAGQEAGEAEGLDLVEYAVQTDALMAVESGKADACIIDITMANAMTGEGTSYDDLKAAISLTEEEYGIAFRKGSDMVSAVNDIIVELTDDGFMNEIAEKYELTLAN